MTTRFVKTLMVCLLFVASIAQAATTEEQRKVQGFGDTYQKAVASALMEAVRQVRGAEVDSEPRLSVYIDETVTDLTYRGKFEAQVVDEVTVKSHGWVKNYEILSVTKPASKDGQWAVTAKVTVPVYKEIIQNDKRLTVAVMPFEIPASSDLDRRGRDAVHNLISRISDSLNTAVVQTGKYAVVNRTHESAFEKERAILRSGDVSPSEASRLGRKLGADVLLVGKVYLLHLDENKQDFYGATRTNFEGLVEVNYSFVEVATEKVLWSDTFNYDAKSKKPEASYPGVKTEKHSAERFISSFVAEFSQNLMANLMDVTYPTRILELQSDQVILLSQGGKRLSVGDNMAVYGPSRTLQSQDGGLPINVEGAQVGKVEVTDVRPDYAVAKLIEGDYNDLKVNAVVRETKIEKAEEAPTHELTPGSSDKPMQWN